MLQVNFNYLNAAQKYNYFQIKQITSKIINKFERTNLKKSESNADKNAHTVN